MIAAAQSTFGAPSRDSILGQPVDAVSREQAIEVVIDRSMIGTPGAYVCLTNVHSTMESQQMPELRAAAERAYLSVPDGMPLVWILRRRGMEHVEKVTGIDYIPRVAKAGLERGLRHFFLGGGPGLAEAAAEGLQKRVPGTEIAGAFTPPFGPAEEWDLSDLRAQLAEQRPHIMWVGLGAPKQELWMADMADELDIPMMVGVGAAFDFLAGTKRAAPRAVSALGLEWLFRLLAEPRRLWRRYLVGNSSFVGLLIRDALKRRSSIAPRDEIVR